MTADAVQVEHLLGYKVRPGRSDDLEHWIQGDNLEQWSRPGSALRSRSGPSEIKASIIVGPTALNLTFEKASEQQQRSRNILTLSWWG